MHISKAKKTIRFNCYFKLIKHSILRMRFEYEQNMYRLKGKQPQQPKPFLLIDIRKYIWCGDNLIIASLYFSFDNLSILIVIQENEGHYVYGKIL